MAKVELSPPVLHSSSAAEGGWKSRNVFLKLLNGNVGTHASPQGVLRTDRRVGQKCLKGSNHAGFIVQQT